MASESMTLYANGPTTELMEMVVAEERRGTGIGRMFIQAVIDWASDRGCTEVNVPSRRAGGYYMKHGFEDAAPRYRFPL
jgi:GNAT superfamily N-acetyltransferase